jgi:hypothetical protein
MELSARQARAVGEVLRADFVVASSVRRVKWDAGETPVVRKVKTKDGPEAEILVYRRRSIVVVCAFFIVRVADGAVVAEGTVESDAVRDATHAVYDGDTGALLLTQQQHRWFDRRRLAEVDRAIEREAAEGGAKGLAEAAFQEIARRLP